MSENLNFTPLEQARLKRLAGERQPHEPVRVDWAPARPTPKKVLDYILSGPVAPNGQPLSPSRVAPVAQKPAAPADDWSLNVPELPEDLPIPDPVMDAERLRQEEIHHLRFTFWASSLSSQQKTQLAACVKWGREPHPQWLVQLAAAGAESPDPTVPPIVLRAPSGPEAEKRFLELCGVTSYGENARLIASPYTEPSAA